MADLRRVVKEHARAVLYVSLFVISLLSVTGALLLPVNEIAKSIAALPFVASLFAALFQLLRDYASLENDRLMQQREHTFMMAATSHMSSVAFDKHVAFSEAYVNALQTLLGELFREGPTKRALELLEPLHEVRREYRLWVSPTVASELDEFESKVTQMGSSLGLWEASQNEYRKGEINTKHLDEAYDIFSELVNMRSDDGSEDEAQLKKDRGYAKVIQHLQTVLGVEKLTQLRDSTLSSS